MRDGLYKKKLEDLLSYCKKNLRTFDENLIRRAFDFSLNAHKKDLRASGEPYFNHPYEVSLIVAREIPLDDISVAAALLHDVAEDTEYEIEDIKKEFGGVIADIVDGATKITDIFLSREITKAESFRKMLLSMVKDVRIMLIKFADRLHNMRTLEFLPPEKRGAIAQETIDIYAPFAHRFGLAKIKWELEDLSFKHLHPVEYEEISKALKATRKARENYIKKFIGPIEKRLKKEGLKFEIAGRPKHIYSIYHKMKIREKSIDELHDLFAVRIILDTDSNADCYFAYGVLSDVYTPIPEKFKDYIALPKKNGYQSIHSTVIGPEGKMVEVQIRTIKMHEIAERGIAAHWRYKEGASKTDKEIESWISLIRDIFEQANEDTSPKQFIEDFKLNLFQDEIYIFTPKGDLKILPKDATPVDFAFEVHSNIGYHCIGAKVNGKIVPLNTKLKSGDQVEIITSKTQKPSRDWEQFVVTNKAKNHLRRYFKEVYREKVLAGKETWEKVLKKKKLHLSEDDLNKFVQTLTPYKNVQEFYHAIKEQNLNPDNFADEIENRLKHPSPVEQKEDKKVNIIEKFIGTARSITGGIRLFGEKDNYLHSFAKCCNPIPGDEIIGMVTVGEGIKIHKKECHNILNIISKSGDRLVEVDWPATNGLEFAAGLYVAGEDRPGLLSDITHAISTYQNTNIRAVKIEVHDMMFDGSIIINVKNTEHLNRIIEKIKKVNGVKEVTRLGDKK